MDLSYVNECFTYKNGNLFWNVRPLHHFKCKKDQSAFNNRFSGNRVGGVSGSFGDKYLNTSINNKMITVHRVVFLMHHGFMPKVVDHIDGNKLNNKIENLRSVTHSENSKNQKMNSNNTSGTTGVFWSKKSNKWQAQITSERKRIHLGCFDNKEQAIKARMGAEKEYGFTETHGKRN